MKKTPVSMRPHIGIFGKRNVGKSSLINALTGQQTAIVSPVAGTTTDPVGKAMEILPLGPVFILDTAGLDDSGTLGTLRIKKTLAALKRTDLILLITTYNDFDEQDKEFIRDKKNTLVIINKSDLTGNEDKRERVEKYLRDNDLDFLSVSSKTGEMIPELRLLIAAKVPETITSDIILRDLFEPEDLIIHIIPIDSAAPKGRIILPQEQVLRECLDHHSVSICIQPEELPQTLNLLNTKPRLVITDSQAIGYVAGETPEEIMLTTYSILFSRLKGELSLFVEGLKALKDLESGDKILIAEACTHHSQPDDIGRVKIPKWLNDYTGKELQYIINPGKMLHQDLKGIKLIVHCGGCMINRKEMLSRIQTAEEKGIPVTNYGVLISHIHQTLKRTIKPFPESYERYLTLFPDAR
jgi:[FeFe] hydrogenase H-cluster maturation GTPase HydF